MALKPNWWRVRGRDIVDAQGQIVRMRGVCLGGWMNMENFATGHPANEARLRQAVAEVLGEGRANFFFERFLDYFITEADLRFISDLGMNVVRVAFNYRHFESDDRPFQYREEGFARLDRLIDWAGQHDLHVILDLHAAPGWQSPGWHCDNPGHRAHFWDQQVFQDRVTALWQVLAERYRGEGSIAGYNLLNEPVASPARLHRLNAHYRKTTEVIRAVDPDHIIFLDGNHYAQRCDQLEPPYDDNTAYSYHFYPEPVLETGRYPAEIDGAVYDQSWLETSLLDRARFMREHDVPVWAGEFGALFNGGAADTAGVHVITDMISVMEHSGHHWTLWHYKDIGPMGVVTVDPASEWMRRTQPVRALKSALRCDYWVERQPTETSRLLDALIRSVRGVTASLPGAWHSLTDEMYAGVCQETLSQLLLPAFAEQFRNMSETEIDRMMQSFAFENCVARGPLADVLRACCPDAGRSDDARR
jgi:endoglucanase